MNDLLTILKANVTLSMVIRLASVLVYTPIFLLPAVLVAAFGLWIGQVYMKAQLSVKREMSNAKAPVLAIFGGAISSLSASLYRRLFASY